MRLLESIRVIKTVVNNTPVLGTVARVASKATRAIVKPNKSLSQKEPRTDPDGKVIENRSFTYARKFKDIVFKTKSRAVLIIGGTLLVGGGGLYHYGVPLAYDILNTLSSTQVGVQAAIRKEAPAVKYYDEHKEFDDVCRSINHIQKGIHPLKMADQERSDYMSCIKAVTDQNYTIVNEAVKGKKNTHSRWGYTFNPLGKKQCIQHSVSSGESLSGIVTSQPEDLRLAVVATDSGIPEAYSNTLQIGQKILICFDSTDRKMENMGW